MSTSVHSGEEAAHTSTEQWQSFEMRMRRRRVDRLLTRASEACDGGLEETAREAIAEIEQLSPFEPRLADLRARLGTISTAARVPAAATTVVAEETPPQPHEITPLTPERSRSVEESTFSVEAATLLPIVPSSIEPELSAADSFMDLPLVIEEPAPAESPRVDDDEPRGGRQFAIAAAALIACGALGWFLGPKMTTFVETPNDVAAESTTAIRTPETAATPAADEPRPTEPLAPVHVAVDEVAARATLEAPPNAPEPVLPQTTSEPPASQPASMERTRTESRVETPVPASSRTEARPPAEPPAPASNSTVPHTPAPVIEKPAPLPPLAENNRPTIPAAPTLTNEPAASVVASAPAPNPAPTSALPPATEPPAAAPRDEEKIRSVLDQYASAYSRLDATAASAIFPGIDRRALARAFDGLAAQSIHLGACDVRIAIESAMVDCAGSATWTPKIGGGSRTEPRRWQFRLRNTSGDWQMVAAKVR